MSQDALLGFVYVWSIVGSIIASVMLIRRGHSFGVATAGFCVFPFLNTIFSCMGFVILMMEERKPTYSEYVAALRSSGFTPLPEGEFASWPASKRRQAIRDYASRV